MKIYVGHLSDRERVEHDLARDPGALGVYGEEDEREQQEAADYAAHLDEQERAFDASQRCSRCGGYQPEECDGDHSEDFL